ncbi:UNVERIFIED_CONTAM: hypothetical protein FKN15_025476 [Acipenser sinensis]
MGCNSSTLAKIHNLDELILETGFAFQLYDQDKDGKISKSELLQVLRMMVGVQVTEEQLESITDRTIQEADLDGDDAISFEEFKKVRAKLRGETLRLVPV